MLLLWLELHGFGIYEELRGLSGETLIPVWTATQTNRAAIDHEVIGADSVGDSYKKVQTADFIMSVSRKTKDKLSNTGRIHIVKNRFGPDGLTFPAKIDTFTGTMDVFVYTSNARRNICLIFHSQYKYTKYFKLPQIF